MPDSKTYKQTALWLELTKRANLNTEAHRIQSLAEGWLDAAEIVLAKAGTQPPDFTLHDEEHAFRVAERMVTLLPDGLLKQLSHYELLMLLLAAYLHDIGMAPPRLKVDAHYNYLLTGAPELLSPEELAAVREWLDNEGHESIPPIPGDATSVDRLHVAQELTAYYCRHRHNDWSEAYICEALPEDEVYKDWRKHLAMVCTSHHHGYEDLVQSRYDPVLKSGAAVHLRYMAVLLRVSDILENDPERTPAVLLHHRGIASKSLVYWWKDQYFDLIFTNRCFSIHGRSSEAIVQKAILDTADAIEAELRLAERLGRETHFDRCNWGSEILPHKWDIASYLVRDIKPADNTYEYINGAFRPNTGKLLQLLSGSNLYDDPLDAVRELLQNSFDAVHERIARQLLSRQNAFNPALEKSLAELLDVTLRFEVTPAGPSLVCTDTGMGMSRNIIENYLLVSGNPYRREVMALERFCREKGFQLGRSGQFGIGVLSYFMVASQVSLRTQRSQDAGDAEGHGWTFTTDGVGSFGELKRIPAGVPGTEVRLVLRTDKKMTDDLVGWYDRLRQYLLDTLVHVPCRFRLLPDPNVGGEPLDIPHGWVNHPDNALNRMVIGGMTRWLRESDEDIFSEASKREREATRRFAESLEAEALTCLRWVHRSGEVGNGLVRYHIHLPYFDLPGGASLAFMRVADEAGRLVVSSHHPHQAHYIHKPMFPRMASWKGMQIYKPRRRTNQREELAIVEVDWLSGEVGELAVSRSAFRPNKTGLELQRQINTAVRGLLREFLRTHSDSPYAALNCSVAQFGTPPASACYWLQMTGGATPTTEWKPIPFPATMRDRTEGQDWVLAGQRVTVLEPVDGIEWKTRDVWPDRVVALKGGELVPYWSAPPAAPPDSHVGEMARFPDVWRHVSGCYFRGEIIWNREHPLVALVEPADMRWLNELVVSPDRFPDFRQELFERRGRMAAWLMHARRHHEFREWLAEQHPAFIGEIMDGLASRLTQPVADVICWLDVGYSFKGSVLHVTNRSGRQSYHLTDKEWQQYLPDPGPAWKLEPAGS